MTVQLPAWLQNGSYTAEIDRYVGTALLNPMTALTGRGGVRRVAGTEFQVTATGPATMNVAIGAGMAFVQGGLTGTQGVYTVLNDATFQVAISASNPSNPRIDLVVLEVLDAVYSGSSNLAQVRVIAGTPAGSPSPPTATGSFITLAQVLVPAAAASVTSVNITDLRPFAGGFGAPIPVRNLTERNALANKYDGLSVFMIDNSWEMHTYVGGEWYGSTPRYFGVQSSDAAFFALGPTDTDPRTVVDRAKITDPGFRYMLRLDTDIETRGARVNASVYCESTTTTSFATKVAWGQTIPNASLDIPGGTPNEYVRLQISRIFPATFTGNRWVTLRVAKDASEDSALAYEVDNFEFNFHLTLFPARPNGFVTATSTGGLP